MSGRPSELISPVQGRLAIEKLYLDKLAVNQGDIELSLELIIPISSIKSSENIFPVLENLFTSSISSRSKG